MSLVMITHSAEYLRSSMDEISYAAHHPLYFFLVLTVLAVLYLAWRTWEFTLSPALHPHEPRKLPYWVPGGMLYFLVDRR